MFFPVGSTHEALETTAAAKAVCGGCPVRDPCLFYAVATRQPYGIFGGLSEDDRRHLTPVFTTQASPTPPPSILRARPSDPEEKR
jgi:WhiB family redox-sensing transcriptional regulator